MKRVRATVVRRPYHVSELLVLLQSILIGHDQPSSNEVEGLIRLPFPWNRSDRYEPPDSERFFRTKWRPQTN